MKLLRYGPAGHEKPAIMDSDGKIRDLSAHVSDIDGNSLGDAELKKIAALGLSGLPEVSASERLGPCVGSVGKLVCIGLNQWPVVCARATRGLRPLGATWQSGVGLRQRTALL